MDVKKIFLWLGIPGTLIVLGIFLLITMMTGILSSQQNNSTAPGVGVGCKLTGDMDREKFDSKMNAAGAFSGKSDSFVLAAEQAMIDPVLLAAIALHETGNGTSNAVKNKNNPGGLMDPNTGWSTLQTFATLDEGITAMALNLNRLYISQGLITIDQIGAKYAPIGAENDPNGLNGYWVPTVTKISEELGGTLSCEIIGDVSGGVIDEDVKRNYQSPFMGIGLTVTSEYGSRWGVLHAGIDLVAYHGAPIRSVSNGVIVDARRSTSYGNMVTIKHPDGVYTRYAHMDFLLVSNGQQVQKGQQIGTQGNTGDSKGSHLHLEFRRGNDYGEGTSFNPRNILIFP